MSSKIEMQKLIELINITDNCDVLLKLFSAVAVHIVTNDASKCDVITNNIIYDKIRYVLSNCQSLKTVSMLNFMTALLYMNEEEEGPSRAQALVLYAQNMFRISGCLLLMCNMFTGCMLHQETWRALCQCLAESCRKSSENQSYCSHLVPMAVQKCIRGNIEALEILKSLICNHEYNTQLFMESDGINIFMRRESLLNDTSMQLLSSLVQNATPDLLSRVHETVFENLSHLKHLYGTQNRIGQWATILWHQLNSRLKKSIGIGKNDCINNHDNNNIVNNESSMIDLGFLKPNDTARLMQNVIREIHQYNMKNNSFNEIGCHKVDLINTIQDNRYNTTLKKYHLQKKPWCQNKEQRTTKIQINETEKCVDTVLNDTSFSFLLKKGSNRSNIEILKNTKLPISQKSSTNIINSTSRSKPICVRMDTQLRGVSNQPLPLHDDTFLSGALTVNSEDPSLLDFNPIYVSTPKKKGKDNKKLNNSSRNSYRHIQSPRRKVSKVINKSIRNGRSINDRDTPRRDVKNRSMTSRLFHAINDSCTTFVKTVKNIFKSKKKDSTKLHQTANNLANTKNSIEPSCSYSFTEYMRKRDALLLNETVQNSHNFAHSDNVRESEYIKSCKTCNDTASLKYKVSNDQYLKETVTKLKLGINLYGCDFKKISKALWPRETYMTPEVLYNLYRKLILK